jgi:hypothetical protein
MTAKKAAAIMVSHSGKFAECQISESEAAQARFMQDILQAEPTHYGEVPFSGACELAFLGDTLESFGRAFDPVLKVVAIGGKQADHFVGAAGGWTCDVAGSEINGLSDDELVLQHLNSIRKREFSSDRSAPAIQRRLRAYTTPDGILASQTRHGKYANLAGISV